MSDHEDRFSGFEIAVVGMACRFPGADGPDAFWQNLKNGVESIQRFSQQELIDLGHDPSIVAKPNFVPAHGVVDNFDTFDYQLFGYTPREAGVMDPQQRLFLELSWEALEHAGYAPKSTQVPVGVFAGTTTNTYLEANVRKNQKVLAAISDFQANVLNQSDFLSTRASYKLGLSGPSFTVQSACSTSLVATHVACQQLIAGACDMALAGGVSITLPENWGYQYQEGMIYSPDGHCHAFDADANGTLKGDGGGIVVLKRLADAIEDGDHIEAVILGSAANNDAQAKVGYTAPGLDGQVEVIQTAMLMADVTSDSITHIECHGTGTPMGDPIEIAALTEAFGEQPHGQHCAVGSVKTNIGHLDAGAGVAGLIKTILALKHKTLPPSLNFQRPNPIIEFEKTPFYVSHQCSEWSTGNYPRRGGVSSFGIGGTNAHIIVEETPSDLIHGCSDVDEEPRLLSWSAQNKDALDEATQRLLTLMQSEQCPSLNDIAFTLDKGRERFAFKRAMVCKSKHDGLEKLSGPKFTAIATTHSDKPSAGVIMMFPGQGAQYVEMGKALYTSQAVFKQHVDMCAQLLIPHLHCNILDILYPQTEDDKTQAAQKLQQTAYTQPALFVIEYALAKLWQANGVKPAALVGHSIGEYAAACLAGVFSLQDALILVANRGALMQALPSGDMLSVALSAELIAPMLDSSLSLAAINSPSLCVVSGPQSSIAKLADSLEEKGIVSKLLKTSHGFHSAMMDPILAPFTEILQRCSFHPPMLPIVSTVTGQFIDPEYISSTQYWLDNIRQSVNFSGAAKALLTQNQYTYLECGPGNTLSSLLRACSDEPTKAQTVETLRHPLETVSDITVFETAQAKLWTTGIDINPSLFADSGNRVALPTYPFQRSLCWVEPLLEQPDKLALAPIFGCDIKQPFEKWFYRPSWQSATLPFLNVDPENESWLVLYGDSKCHADIVNQLTEQGVRSLVSADLQDLAAVKILCQQLATDDKININHVAVIGDMPSISTANVVPTCLPFFTLLDAFQGILSQIDVSQVSLSYVTRNACAISDAIISDVERLMPLGILRSLREEYPGLKTRFINLVDENVSTQTLLNEMRQTDPTVLVSFEFGQRWKQVLEPITLPEPSSAKVPFKSAGTYLITGGLGSMGMAYAEHLVKNYQANLILLARTPLPDASVSANTLDSNDKTNKRIASLKAMQESNLCEVCVVHCDVSNLAAMQQLKQDLRTRFGKIDGVIHTAGIPGGGIVETLDKEDVNAVFSAKVLGTWVLQQTFAAEQLDFMILCSSLTSFIDRPGRAEYAAANYYMDAVANQPSTSSSTPIISINWDAWSGSAMSQTAGAPSAEDRIEKSLGVDALERSLISGLSQVVVSTRNLMPEHDFVVATEASKDAINTGSTQTFLGDDEPLEEIADPNLSPAQRILLLIWKDLLGVESLSVDDNFFELGGDSIVSLQMTSRAAQQGLKITTRQVFENQTIAELASQVEDQISESSGRSGITTQKAPKAIEIITGELPLTPIQHWFFARNFLEPQHWNLYQEVSLPEGASSADLLKLLDLMVQQHDMLRVRFTKSGDQWQQAILAHETLKQDTLLTVDASKWTDYQQQLDDYIGHVSTQFELNNGCLYRFVKVDGVTPSTATQDNESAVKQSRLVVVVHHLLVDIVSLNVLFHDMQSAWSHIFDEAIQLPDKSSSFKHWADKIVAFPNTPDFEKQCPYWRQFAGLNQLPLPKDFINGVNTVESSQQMTACISPAVTDKMTRSLAKQNYQPKDILLCGLVMALADFSGQSRINVEVEEHGRDAFSEELDVSRTLGWFTKAFPVICDVPAGNNPAAAVSYIHQVAAVTSQTGLVPGLIPLVEQQSKLPIPELNQGIPSAEVVFLYLGNVSQGHQSGDFSATSVCRASRHGQQIRTHTFEVSVWIEEGEAKIALAYSDNCYQQSTMEQLLRQIQHQVESLVSGLLVDNPQKSDLTTTSGQSREVTSSQDLLPLSFAQERVWFLEQIEQQSTLNNKHSVIKLVGQLNLAHLRDAINKVVDVHQSLRTCFVKVDGEPRQHVLPNISVALPVISLTGQDSQTVQTRLAEISREEIAKPFDLQQAPLLRFTLVEESTETAYLLVTIHHIVTDAWSMQLFFAQLEETYQQLEQSSSPTLAVETTPQYSDFVNWQLSAANTPEMAESLAYWCEKLAGIPARLTLPTDRPRPSLQSFSGDRVDIPLNAKQIGALRGFCISQGVSVNMAMLAVFKVLLAKYSGQTDIVVGTPVANRSQQALEGVIGLLVNNLVLRSQFSAKQTFKDLLAHIKGEVLDANEHADVPFEKVVQAINPERDRSQSPLFQVMMVFMNAPQVNNLPRDKNTLSMLPTETHNEISEFDLSLYVYELGSQHAPQGESLTAWVEFNTDLFDRSRIEQFVHHYCYLLEQAIADHTIQIQAMQLLSESEKQQTVGQSSQGKRLNLTDSQGRDIKLESLLTNKLANSIHQQAVRCADHSVNYLQLDQHSAGLANQLQSKGVGPGVAVAIYLNRSIDMLTAMLAVIRAGGCYVPIDPSFPTDRIDYMLADSETRLILTDDGLRNNLNGFMYDTLLQTDWRLQLDTNPKPHSQAKSTDLAYIIYTSGSTGLPKGVRIERHNMINFLMSMADTPGLQESDVFVAVTTISFDIHVLELWLPLIVGAQLVIADSDQTADGNALLALLRETNATVMQATPATWQLLLQCGWDTPMDIRALCGGEALTNALTEKLLPLTQSICNMYGPTETCVWSSVKWIVAEEKTITVGKPIHNTQFYTVDKDMNLLPPGIPGELLIGGEGVVRDYFKRDELTAKQFVENPIFGMQTGRLYRTGDAAIRLFNGEFLVVGRFDNQVKLRGYRIELGEIESRLRKHPDIRDAVVGIRGDEEDKKLVAWLQGNKAGANEQIDSSTLRSFLTQTLPHYMIPSAFVWVEEFAKTPNNKIDRKALKEPIYATTETVADAELQTDAERLVAEIFAAVLKTQSVGRYDNFFDLGGHSLLSMKVVDAIESRTGVRVHPGELFQQSVGQIAAMYEEQFSVVKEKSDA